MDWIRTNGRMPAVEFVVVALVTLVATLFTMSSQLTDRLHLLEGQPGFGTDLADFGPGLLVLAIGLGIMTYRRLRESERQRALHEAASSARSRSEVRYRSLVEASPDPVFVIREMVIEYANPAAIAFLGAASEEVLLGRSVLDLLPPDSRRCGQAWFESALASGGSATPIEQSVMRLDGTTVETETALVRTPYEGGFAIQAVVRDLSARHAADEAMARYQVLSENTQDILYFATAEGRIVDCNEAAVLRYGYTKEELTAMTVFDLRAPGSTTPTVVETTHVPGDTARSDEVHVLKDGSLIELSVTAQRVRIGSQEMVVSVCRDVTERRAAERELRESEARYRTLIETAPSAVMVYDASRTIVFANRAMLDLMRAHDESEIVGRDARTLIDDDSRKVASAAEKRLEGDGATASCEVRMIRSDGTPVAVQTATSHTVYNGAEAFLVVIQDVSRLKSEAENLMRTTENTIAAMARLVEKRDPYTSGHQERVAAMAFRIASRMSLPESTCETIRLAGIVHDIGKMNVPIEILSKPGRLNELEFALIKGHAQNGYELLLPIEFPWPLAEIVRQHHERLDGSGYPRGLQDGAICIEARVLAVADTVEAMSSDRPYRPVLGLEAALRVIRGGRGRLYDPSVVDAAVALASTGELIESGTEVAESLFSAA